MSEEWSKKAIEAGAMKLAETIGIMWDGLDEGSARARGFPPWKAGGDYNARKGDYRDLVRDIIAAAQAQRDKEKQS